MAHLKSTPLAEMSRQYSDLRVRLVDHQLDCFSGHTALADEMLLEDSISGPSADHTSAVPSLEEQDTNNDAMFTFTEWIGGGLSP